MAGKIKFAETIRRPLQSAKSDCLPKISTGDGIKIVSDFFRELDGAVGVLDKKYNDRSRDRYVQRLLPSRGMVARAFRKVHSKVIRRLTSRLKLANPWFGEFTVDMPMEVMECISKHISWTEQILVMNLVKQPPNCFTKSVIFERQNIYSKEWKLKGLKLTMRIF